MSLAERDAAYLYDIITAARDLAAVLAGEKEREYLSNRTLQLATERAIEITGGRGHFRPS